MNVRKRILALFICIMMVLSPMATISAFADETGSGSGYTDLSGNPQTPVGELTLGVPQQVVGMEKRAYSFTPAETGFYLFYNDYEEYVDAKAVLFNSETQIAEDDDSRGNSKFIINAELEAGVTYYLEVSAYGEGTYDITVIKSPVEKIEFVSCDFAYIEHDTTTGYWNDNGTDKYFYYIPEEAAKRALVEVTYNDGREPEQIGYYDIDENLTGLSATSGQWYDTPWEVNGSDNTITLTYMGKSCTFNVSVVDNPVDSIEIHSSDLSYIEHDTSVGRWSTAYNGDNVAIGDWFCYYEEDVLRNTVIKVNFKDSDREPAYIDCVKENGDYNVQFVNNQSYETPWTVGGNNTITIQYFGKSCELPVNVVANPVASIELVSCDYIYTEQSTQEGSIWEDEGGEYFHYDSWRAAEKVIIKVNYNDGRPSEYIQYYDEEGESTGLSYFDNQGSAMPWKIGGQNIITFTYKGKSCTYNAVIKKNPIEKIEVYSCNVVFEEEDAKDGYWDYLDGTDQQFFCYYSFRVADEAIIKVTYNDGRPAEYIRYYDEYGRPTGLEYECDQYRIPWTVGSNNIVKFTYGGKTCTCNVTVRPNPVASFELVSADSELIEYDERVGYWEEETETTDRYFYYYTQYIIENAKFKITYNDGRAPEEVYGKNLNVNTGDNQSADNPWLFDENDKFVTAEYKGFTVKIPVTIKENHVASIAVKSNNLQYVENDSRYGDYDGEGEGVFFRYSSYLAVKEAEIEVTYDDGRPSEIIPYYFTSEKEEDWSGITCEDDQSYNNQWTVGGQNNTITVRYMGAETTMNATLVASKVESIEFVSCDYKFIENNSADGWWASDGIYENEGEYFWYYPYSALKDVKIKVNYNDGTPSEVIAGVDEFNNDTGIQLKADHQYENKWTVGGINNTVTVIYQGKICTFNAAVVDGPFDNPDFSVGIRTGADKKVYVSYRGEQKTKIVVPEKFGEYTVVSLEPYAFGYYSYMETVYLPATLDNIGYSAFDGCTALKNIYFGGSEAQWKAIDIDYERNDALKKAKIIYYSDTNGNCIHPSTSTVTVAATCGKNGAINKVCNHCKKTISSTKIAATGKHSYNTTTVKGTTSRDGHKTTACKVCGNVKDKVVYKKAVIKLSSTLLEYNGKVRTPKVTVKTSAGKTISSKYYTVKYSNSKSKKIGSYKVTVTFKGNYSGKKTLTYSITSKKTAITSLKAGKKAFTVKYKKQTTGSGYEIQYSTSSKFKSAKTVTVKSNKTVSKTVKKLTSKKTYYVRVRTVKGKIKSDWSATKKVKVK